jgi:DNA-binding LytR/AlgR family response regulator
MFTAHFKSPKLNDMEKIPTTKKTRLIVKHGAENIALCVADIALLYTQERTVCVIDKFAKRYCLNRNLSEVQEELDEQIFFRANRQHILNINFVRGFRIHENVKLKVDLTLDGLEPTIIISRETAPHFKKWLCES